MALVMLSVGDTLDYVRGAVVLADIGASVLIGQLR
jgi:hypothetical protein